MNIYEYIFNIFILFLYLDDNKHIYDLKICIFNYLYFSHCMSTYVLFLYINFFFLLYHIYNNDSKQKYTIFQSYFNKHIHVNQIYKYILSYIYNIYVKLIYIIKGFNYIYINRALQLNNYHNSYRKYTHVILQNICFILKDYIYKIGVY